MTFHTSTNLKYHCIKVFSDAVFLCCRIFVEESCMTGYGHAVAHDFSFRP